VSSWPLVVVAVCLGVSGACLASEPPPAKSGPAAPAAGAFDSSRHLSLDLPLQSLGAGGSSVAPGADPAKAAPQGLALSEGNPGQALLDLHFGRGSRMGRMPGDPPTLFGEVGIDLDPSAGLSLEPSYRMVLNQGERPDSRAIAAQVLKLGARIRF
jgi:hypothetical protein